MASRGCKIGRFLAPFDRNSTKSTPNSVLTVLVQQSLNWVLGRYPPHVSIRLADTRRRYNLPRYRPHHALTDALASAELLQAQVAHRFSPTTPLRDLWK